MPTALRLYPPITSCSRQAKCDTILPTGGGLDGTSPIFIAKGQVALSNVHALHRDTTLWGLDADQFIPERWEAVRGGYKYLPFGGGPRMCVGRKYLRLFEISLMLTTSEQMALTEVGYTIVRLFQTFSKIEKRDDDIFREKVGITLSMEGELKCALFE